MPHVISTVYLNNPAPYLAASCKLDCRSRLSFSPSHIPLLLLPISSTPLPETLPCCHGYYTLYHNTQFCHSAPSASIMSASASVARRAVVVNPFAGSGKPPPPTSLAA